MACVINRNVNSFVEFLYIKLIEHNYLFWLILVPRLEPPQRENTQTSHEKIRSHNLATLEVRWVQTATQRCGPTLKKRGFIEHKFIILQWLLASSIRDLLTKLAFILFTVLRIIIIVLSLLFAFVMESTLSYIFPAWKVLWKLSALENETDN